MRFPDAALVGLAAQTPLSTLVQPTNTTNMRRINPDFKLKEGKHLLSPKNMLELPRPGAGSVNVDGDLLLVPVSKYSFEESKYVAAVLHDHPATKRHCRTHKSFYIASVDSPISPYEVPLTSGGDVFWLDSHTIGHVVSNDEEKVQELYAISVKVETQSETIKAFTPESPVLIGKLPTSPDSPAGNFIYRPNVEALVRSPLLDHDMTWADHRCIGLLCLRL
jgi:hypothetical protein